MLLDLHGKDNDDGEHNKVDAGSGRVWSQSISIRGLPISPSQADVDHNQALVPSTAELDVGTTPLLIPS